MRGNSSNARTAGRSELSMSRRRARPLSPADSMESNSPTRPQLNFTVATVESVDRVHDEMLQNSANAQQRMDAQDARINNLENLDMLEIADLVNKAVDEKLQEARREFLQLQQQMRELAESNTARIERWGEQDRASQDIARTVSTAVQDLAQAAVALSRTSIGQQGSDNVVMSVTSGLDETEREDDMTEYLKFLHRLDCRNPEHMKRLKQYDDVVIDLAIFNPDTNLPADYSIRRGGAFSESLLARSRDSAKVSRYYETEEWSAMPRILELQEHEWSAAQGQANTLPRYVLDLGELYAREENASTKQWVDRSTSYHLVMDVTRPQKSLWLSFSYAREGPKSLYLLNNPSTSLEQNLFGYMMSSSFDVALVYEDVTDWFGLQTKKVKSLGSIKRMRNTRQNAGPIFTVPDLVELKSSIEAGWAGWKHDGH